MSSGNNGNKATDKVVEALSTQLRNSSLQGTNVARQSSQNAARQSSQNAARQGSPASGQGAQNSSQLSSSIGHQPRLLGRNSINRRRFGPAKIVGGARITTKKSARPRCTNILVRQKRRCHRPVCPIVARATNKQLLLCSTCMAARLGSSSRNGYSQEAQQYRLQLEVVKEELHDEHLETVHQSEAENLDMSAMETQYFNDLYGDDGADISEGVAATDSQ